MRLTVLYGLSLVLGASAVLAIAYGLVVHDTGGQTRDLELHGVQVPLLDESLAAVARGTSPIATSRVGRVQLTAHRVSFPDGTEVVTWTRSSPAARRRAGAAGGRSRVDRIESLARNQVDLTVDRANDALVTQRRRSLRTLLTWSGVALGAMAAISILLGWLLAGRALRPMRLMSGRARRITEENLHERVAVDPADDELGELAVTFDGVLARLERAFDAQRRFVANASHELRTPLTLERLVLETTLADPDADTAQLRHACERVLASTAQQERTIEALLALARSQGGTDVDVPADLAELARDTITLRGRRLDGLTVATDLHPATLTGDPALLERLVANLIDNAAVHNRADGWISVETGHGETDSWLRVSNSGPDVPETMLSEIFEPFRRLDGERTATAVGLGLGLSIVRAIADVHGATIDARPVKGGGLEVEVRFPERGAGRAAIPRSPGYGAVTEPVPRM